MGQPADRAEGVVLVTDYGALDAALAAMARREELERENEAKIVKMRESEAKTEQ